MKIKFANQLIIALILGIIVGLFIGEDAAIFKILGDAFIGLMQMTVLPYIMVALIANLAKIEFGKSKKLIGSAAVLLFLLLGIGVLITMVVPLFFPTFQSASFFSNSMITDPEIFDFVGTYIPANLFFSMSSNVVPAVVLFSIFLGIALNGLKTKGPLIRALDTLADALNKANKIIIKLTPYGIFGIAAYTAGTISFDEIELLQVYLIAYSTVVVVLAFIFLPLLIAALTPFTYKDILKVTKATIIAIFATSKIIILLPQMIDDVKRLFKKYGKENDEVDASVELLLPLAYPFPNLGTLTIMIFIPFAAWFTGRSFDFSETMLFTGATLMSSFVSPITGIPFLLNLMKLPNDVFQLFILSSIWTDRIRVVLGAMHLYTIVFIAIAFVQGMMKVNVKKLILAIAFAIASLLLLNIPLKYMIGDSFQETFDKYKTFIHMDYDFVPANTVNPETFREIPKNIKVIKDRGYIRVGYYPDALPYVFQNIEGRKVGFDAEIANQIALDLDVDIQWIEVPRGQVPKYVNDGVVDLMMSGIPIVLDDLDEVNYSTSYAILSASLIVKDYRRSDFKTVKRINEIEDLSIGMLPSNYIEASMRDLLPTASFEEVPSPRKFFRDSTDRYDALLMSAEGGSAWTLVYPDYTILVPEGLKFQLPVSIVMAHNNTELVKFINQWIELNKIDGTIDKAYSFWILGKGSESTEKRWSIMRDELHWFE